ncbi:MAG: MarR family transcriptional regulator [Myxococcota bacterium]
MGISRDLQARVRESLTDRGHPGLRPSFGPLLSLVREEGRPLSALAAELGVSTQAGSQLVKAAEAAGILQRRPNPADRRSKLVVPTRKGRALIEGAVEIILATETEYAAHVGAPAYRRFIGALSTLYRALRLPMYSEVLAARTVPSVGVVPPIALYIEREAFQATCARGHPALKMAFAPVLGLIGPAGGRIHEMARVQRVSRQAISAIAHELVVLGYLERLADPRDGRGVVLVLSKAGNGLIRDSVEAIGELEDRFRAVLGPREFEALEQMAGELYHALRLEAEVFGTPPAGEGGPGGHDVRRLALRLQRSLGRGDADRLASLLGRPRGGSTT